MSADSYTPSLADLDRERFIEECTAGMNRYFRTDPARAYEIMRDRTAAILARTPGMSARIMRMADAGLDYQETAAQRHERMLHARGLEAEVR